MKKFNSLYGLVFVVFLYTISKENVVSFTEVDSMRTCQVLKSSIERHTRGFYEPPIVNCINSDK